MKYLYLSPIALISACALQSSSTLDDTDQELAHNGVYIVQLADQLSLTAIERMSTNPEQETDAQRVQLGRLYTKLQDRVRARYSYALHGFAVASNDPAEIEALRASPLVKHVQPDFEIKMGSPVASSSENTAGGPVGPIETTTSGTSCREILRFAPGYALPSLDERNTDVFDADGRFTQRCQQDATSEAPLIGKGVRMFLLDTGIDRFEDGGQERMAFLDIDRAVSRIKPGFSAIAGLDPYITNNLTGTYFAGAAIGGYSETRYRAGNAYTEMIHGVAPGSDIVSVRIYDNQGVGTGSGVLSAIDFITRTAIEQPQPSVVHANIVLHGIVDVFEDAIRTSTRYGNLLYVFPSGFNSAPDACISSTNRMFDALNVGVLYENDAKWTIGAPSGNCVDFYAPGDRVATILDHSGTYRGTGFSSAFAAGTAAMLLQNHPDSTPAELRKRLICDTTVGVLHGQDNALPNTPNRRIYTNNIGNPAPDTVPDTTGPAIKLETPHTIIPVSGAIFRVGVLDCSDIVTLELHIDGSSVATLRNPSSGVHDIAWQPQGFHPKPDGMVNIALIATDVHGNSTQVDTKLQASSYQSFLPITRGN